MLYCYTIILHGQLDFSTLQSSITSEKLYFSNWETVQNWRYPYIAHNKHRNRKIILSCPGDISFIKDIAFAVQRSQKPICITAFKFSILSLKSFTAVCIRARCCVVSLKYPYMFV